MKKLKFFVFGTPRFILEGQEIQFGRRKALALVAYLIAKNQAQSLDVLCELLWSGYSTARANLRRELSLLNSISSEKILQANRSRVAINPDVKIEIDLHEFREKLILSKIHLDSVHLAKKVDIEILEDAIELYTDDFLAGFSISDSIAFDDWQYYETERIRRAYGEGLQSLVTWYSQKRQYDKAIDYAQRFLNIDPYYENAHRLLMSLFAQSGQHRNALAQYEACQELLQSELDVLPETETSTLYEKIRSREFIMPEAENDNDALRHNIPVQTTIFVGRETETNDLIHLISATDSRLITIVAHGGMGKTRLSLEVARRLIETEGDLFREGIFQVELAPVSQTSNIVASISNVIGFAVQQDERSPKQQLLDYLKNKNILLICDNFEHLLEGANLLSELLQIVPGLKILVTSREILTLKEEAVFRIKGLESPDNTKNEIAQDYPVVQLFLNTAKRINPHFKLNEVNVAYLVEICRLVGGMPLGIILAASWLDAMTLEEIAREISQSLDLLSNEVRNLPKRHHNIRAVFDPTWQNLAEEERQIFMKLSVFHGGFTQQAAERVAGTTIRQLARLVKKSLLGRDLKTGRYRIHELLRQYAGEHLGQSDLDVLTRNSHSDYYLTWLGSLKDDLEGRRQIETLNEIDADSDNVYEAWKHAVASRSFVVLGDALLSFYHYHDMRSYFTVVEEILRDTLGRLSAVETEDEQYILSRIDLVYIHILINGFRRFDKSYRERVLQHLQRAEERNDYFEIASAKGHYATIIYWGLKTNQYKGKQLYKEAIQHFRATGDSYQLADLLGGASLYDLDNHLVMAIESIDIKRKAGNRFGLIWSLQLLAIDYLEMGNYALAITNTEEMLELAQLFANPAAISRAYVLLTMMHFYKGNFDEAMNNVQGIEILEKDHGWYTQMNAISETFSCLIDCVQFEDYEDALERLENNDFEKYWDHTPISLTFAIAYCGSGNFALAKSHLRTCLNEKESYIGVGRSELGVFAILLAESDEPVRAVEILALTKQQLEGHVGWFWKWSLVDRLMTSLRAELGDDIYNEAWERGSKLNGEEAILDVLKEL